MCFQAVEHEEAALSDFSVAIQCCDLKVSMMSNNKCSVFESTGGGAQSYFVDECPHYRVNFVQFRCCWDWRSCRLYGIRRFPHSSDFDHTQTDVNTLGTKQSICLQYHRWPLFRGFHKAGFHCIWE